MSVENMSVEKMSRCHQSSISKLDFLAVNVIQKLLIGFFEKVFVNLDGVHIGEFMKAYRVLQKNSTRSNFRLKLFEALN